MFTVIQIIQLAALVILLVALLVLFCAVDLMVDLSKKGQDISGKIIIKWLFISYSRVFYPTESYPTESEGPDLKKEQDEDKKEEVENIGKRKKD